MSSRTPSFVALGERVAAWLAARVGADESTGQAVADLIDDIVPALRARAPQAILDRLEPQFATELTELLPLLSRLSQRSRAGASAVLRAVTIFCVTDENGRRALAQRGPLETQELIFLVERALSDSDSRLARWAAVESTSSRASTSVATALLPQLESHHDAFVRRRAVLAYAHREDGIFHLERALSRRASCGRLRTRPIHRCFGRVSFHSSGAAARTHLANRSVPQTGSARCALSENRAGCRLLARVRRGRRGSRGWGRCGRRGVRRER